MTRPSSISSLFMEREIDTIIIQSGTDPEIQFEVFGRLNQGSVSLNPQELRNCMFHGIFNDFLINCSRNAIYRELLEPFSKFKTPKEGTADKNRMFDVELVLRFFCLSILRTKLKGDKPVLAKLGVLGMGFNQGLV